MFNPNFHSKPPVFQLALLETPYVFVARFHNFWSQKVIITQGYLQKIKMLKMLG